MNQLQLQKVLGTGAFGTVYLGMYQTSQRSRYVAVKVMSKEGASNDEFLRRLRDEAKLLALLNTSLIIKVLGSCQIRGLNAVVLEYVDGIDMYKLLTSNIHLPSGIIAAIGAKVDACCNLILIEKPHKQESHNQSGQCCVNCRPN